MLVREKVISRHQLDEATNSSASSGNNPIHHLLDDGILDDGFLSIFISEKLSIPLADRTLLEAIPSGIIRTIARDLVDEYNLIPVAFEKNQLKVAMIDPTDKTTLEELKFFLGKKISPMVASQQWIYRALNRYYSLPRTLKDETLRTAPSPAPKIPTATPLPPSSQPSPSMAKVPWVPPVPAPPEHPLPPPAPVPEPKVDPVMEMESNPTDMLAGLPETIPGPGKSAPHDPPLIGWQTEKELDRMAPKTRPTPLPLNSPVSASGRPSVIPSPGSAPVALPVLSPKSELEESYHQSAKGLEEAASKDQIADLFLSFSQKILNRVALFTIKKNVLLGWRGSGQELNQKNLKGIMIPLNSPSVFQRVRETRVYYLGEVPANTVNQIFLTALGNRKPENVLIIPICIKDRVICIFYGDHIPHPIPADNIHFLHLLVPKVERAFEQLIYRMKKQPHP